MKNCEECGERLRVDGTCENIDCPDFWMLEDEYGNVRELDFSTDESDRWGELNEEDFIDDDYPEDFFDEQDE